MKFHCIGCCLSHRSSWCRGRLGVILRQAAGTVPAAALYFSHYIEHVLYLTTAVGVYVILWTSFDSVFFECAISCSSLGLPGDVRIFSTETASLYNIHIILDLNYKCKYQY